MKKRLFSFMLGYAFFQNISAQNTAADLNFPPPENPPAVRAMKTTDKFTLDVLGRAVWAQQTDGEQLWMNLSALPAGAYRLQVLGAKKTGVLSLVLSR